MLIIKPGARILGTSPCIWVGARIIEGIFERYGKSCVITSGIDGSHSRASLHYAGMAVDIRSKELDETQKDECVNLARSALGEDFDFILESVGTDNEHFHLEFQPKSPY